MRVLHLCARPLGNSPRGRRVIGWQEPTSSETAKESHVARDGEPAGFGIGWFDPAGE